MIRVKVGARCAAMASDDELPKGPEDWIRVAERELGNIAGSYKGGLSADAKIDHAIKATEARNNTRA